jgi:hypothetical protein
MEDERARMLQKVEQDIFSMNTSYDVG